MRNPKFKEIAPNYRRKVLVVTLQEGRKTVTYELPFAVFRNHKISTRNRFVSLEIDRELDRQAVLFELEDGTTGDFPADLVLYYCDPTYAWSPLNQLKQAIKEKLKQSKLSIRVLADALQTSSSQVMRLLNEQQLPKQFLQLFHLAELAGYTIQFELHKKKAA